jgi:hypothetical protein
MSIRRYAFDNVIKKFILRDQHTVSQDDFFVIIVAERLVSSPNPRFKVSSQGELSWP